MRSHAINTSAQKHHHNNYASSGTSRKPNMRPRQVDFNRNITAIRKIQDVPVPKINTQQQLPSISNCSEIYDQWTTLLNANNSQSEAALICSIFKAKLSEVPVPEINEVQSIGEQKLFAIAPDDTECPNLYIHSQCRDSTEICLDDGWDTFVPSKQDVETIH